MNNMRGIRFWKNWGLVSRLMLAVGIAIITGGGVQTALLVAEGAAEHSARLKRELNETLTFIAPLIADQALVGEYAVISQLLKNQVQKGEIDSFQWTDKDGKKLVAQDKPDTLERAGAGSRRWRPSSARKKASRSRRAASATAGSMPR